MAETSKLSEPWKMLLAMAGAAAVGAAAVALYTHHLRKSSESPKKKVIKRKHKYEPMSLEWCKNLPKVELHAHLHGCIRDSTIELLLREEQNLVDFPETSQQKETLEDLQTKQKHVATFKKGDRSLEECFQVFTLLHRLVKSERVILRITREAIQDYAEENVKYLELRTTPRAIPSQKFSKESYVKTVLRGMEECRKEGYDVIVRLILSIDRSSTLKEAFDTVELAKQYKDQGVVGIDFSGNPLKNGFDVFMPAFERARSYGLKTTVHVAEIWQSELDTLNIVNFHPDRLGHGVCLSALAEKMLHERPIPIEICPTSNIKTRIASSFDQHPFGEFVKRKYPVVICTDDSGVFSITLSSEYMNMANAFRLAKSQVYELACEGIEYIFAGEDIKANLREKFAMLKPRDV